MDGPEEIVRYRNTGRSWQGGGWSSSPIYLHEARSHARKPLDVSRSAVYSPPPTSATGTLGTLAASDHQHALVAHACLMSECVKTLRRIENQGRRKHRPLRPGARRGRHQKRPAQFGRVAQSITPHSSGPTGRVESLLTDKTSRTVARNLQHDPPFPSRYRLIRTTCRDNTMATRRRRGGRPATTTNAPPPVQHVATGPLLPAAATGEESERAQRANRRERLREAAAVPPSRQPRNRPRRLHTTERDASPTHSEGTSDAGGREGAQLAPRDQPSAAGRGLTTEGEDTARCVCAS